MSDVAELLLSGWTHNLNKVDALLADIAPQDMTRQPPGAVNHPAWTLAHLIHYHPAIASLASGQPIADPGKAPNADRYDAGSVPMNKPSLYPSKDELLASYRAGHATVATHLQTATPKLLRQLPGLPRWQKAFPTAQHALMYLMIYHEAVHIGQIMLWRRAVGMAPLE